MSSKTKIVVLHIKEIIYTVIFLLLIIAFVILLVIMFGKKHSDPEEARTASYTPGVYTSTVTLSGTTLEVEVAVDESHINSIRFANLDESVAAMYPLVEPAIEEIADQVYDKQNLDEIEYSDSNPYTSMMIKEAIGEALEKAKP